VAAAAKLEAAHYQSLVLLDATAIHYGESVRLYTVSRYAEADEPGGYVGYYLRGGDEARRRRPGQRRSKGRLLVAVPPLSASQTERFAESCCEVVDPKGEKKEGDLLRYGDEVVLVDDQKMVWNNVTGVGGIGPKLPGMRGEVHLKLRRNPIKKQAATTTTTDSAGGGEATSPAAVETKESSEDDAYSVRCLVV
jgi:hypothetical protein